MYILYTRTPSLLDTIYYSHEYPRGANYSLGKLCSTDWCPAARSQRYIQHIGRNWGENDWSNTTHHNKATVVLFRGKYASLPTLVACMKYSWVVDEV